MMATQICPPATPIKLLRAATAPKLLNSHRPSFQLLGFHSNHWLSQINSSIISIRLLKKAINKQIDSCTSATHLGSLQSINKRLSWLCMHEHELRGKVITYRQCLKALAEEPNAQIGQSKCHCYVDLALEV